MSFITVTGMKEVTKELQRLREAQTPAINRAVADAAKFGEKAAIDAIFNKYGFKSKSYVDDLIGFSVSPKDLKGYVTARYRPSTLTRFSTAKTRIGKNGRSRSDGHIVNSFRNEPHGFKGTFTFIGRNGNLVMYERHRGQKWRTFKEAKKAGNEAMYGPSVLKAFRGVEANIEPPIIRYLRERYGHHASR